MDSGRLSTSATARSLRWATFALALCGVGAGACGPQGASPPPIRIAPRTCPPDPVTGETDLWTAWERIRLPGGRLLELRGCHSPGNGWIELDYRGGLPGPGLHLVQYHLYEGGGWFVVGARTGQVERVSGRPVFSPEGGRFATGMVDLEAGYHRNHLDIWSVEGDSTRRVLRLDGEDDWGAADLRWASVDTLEYLPIGWAEGPRPPPDPASWFDTTRARVVRDGGSWRPEVPE